MLYYKIEIVQKSVSVKENTEAPFRFFISKQSFILLLTNIKQNRRLFT